MSRDRPLQSSTSYEKQVHAPERVSEAITYSLSSVHQQKQACLATGTYQIVNVETGAYAGLINDNDQSDLVNITIGLIERNNKGSEVRLGPFAQL